METSDVARASEAATSVASSLGLRVDDAVVLHSSNRLVLRLTPGDVLARVTRVGHEDAGLELERARQLAAAGCPVGAPDPRVDPVVRTRGGFDVTLWTYYSPVAHDLPPADHARALERLHAGMREAPLTAPRFTDRIAEAQQVAADPELSPGLGEADRTLLAGTLESLRRTVTGHAAPEQLLHGEPHPGNVLHTEDGPRFIDFETCCRGPVEFDLAHVPEAVGASYPDVDRELLAACRHLVLAMVAAWRWRLGDEFPHGRAWGEELLRRLRAGPPWRALGTLGSHPAPQVTPGNR